MVIHFGETRKEAGWAPAGKTRDLCAVPATQPAVLGAMAVGCQQLLQPLPCRALRGALPARRPQCPARWHTLLLRGSAASAGELRPCSSQQVNEQIPALAGNRLLFNKEL